MFVDLLGNHGDLWGPMGICGDGDEEKYPPVMGIGDRDEGKTRLPSKEGMF